MSGVHKYPTISFRVSPRQREEMEARIMASGLAKKDYFIRSCMNNRVCVVGKKELVYRLVEELKMMQTNIREVTEQFEREDVCLTSEGLKDMRNDCLDMLKAIIWMLDGAKYLWQDEGQGKNGNGGRN
ncbi:MAG: hypothetical protein HFI03_02445 [Lachnospiraceae bacterium]|jgi:hypothetical protein|nr:hypothetical protein [Lachnospiraceae bacterium]